jgi:hypothetical protein
MVEQRVCKLVAWMAAVMVFLMVVETVEPTADAMVVTKVST